MGAATGRKPRAKRKEPAARAVNVYEAKTCFSSLLARVENGEEVVIARAGKPVAKLVPVEPKSAQRAFGQERGKFVVPDDFDDPLPDGLLAEFYK